MTTETISETETPERGPCRAMRKLPMPHPVWWLNIAVLGAAAALYAGPVHDLPALDTPHIPWWLVAIAFAVAERGVVHLHFRRGAHSFSLADIPLVLALIFTSADGVVLGCLVGSTAMLLLNRRLPPIKLCFNIAQLALATLVTLIVIHALAPVGEIGPLTWVAALVAMGAGGLVTVLLVIPGATLFVAYRAYLAERERHKRLEFLYEANRTLARSREVAHALEGLLARSLEAFRAELAEIILFGSDDKPSIRTLLGPGAYHELMEPIDDDIAEELRALVQERGDGATKLNAPFRTERLQRYLEGRGVSHAIVAPLPGEERVIGTIMLANRFGVVRSFDDDDLRLLDTLASNASVALQYDRLEQAVMQLSVLQEQLHHQAYHDPLTSLANRVLFAEKVKQAISAGGSEVAVLFIDLDDFKTVNDSLGHSVGDELLVAVALRLRGCLRPEDLVARLGGDEFAVMVQDGDAEMAATGVARRIMDAFTAPVVVGLDSVAVHASVGIATNHQRTVAAEDLIRDADVAMYKAKTSGKGTFEIFNVTMGTEVLERHGLKEELRLAIDRDELTLYFQPIVSLETGDLVAVEALVRWEHPRRGLVGPSEFVPLAEETGLILGVGQYVLEEACRHARRWKPEVGADDAHQPAVHVNLSAVELRDPTLVERVRHTLTTTGVDPRRLVFEVTETLLLGDSERVSATLAQLRELGVRFALDDFGTGYSSLSYLHTLPLDILKIAKSFVDGLGRGGREASFVRMIIELARTLGLSVIAGGIETREQASALAALECEYGQGFHLGRPRPAEDDRPLGLAA